MIDGHGGRGRRWHGASEIRRGQREDPSGSIRVCEGIEFPHWSNVPGARYRTAHEQHGFDAEEGGRVFGGGESDVGEGPDGDDGNGVWWILGKNAEDLEMRFDCGRCEERGREFGLCVGGSHSGYSQERIGRRTIEKMFPAFFRAAMMRMLEVGVTYGKKGV